MSRWCCCFRSILCLSQFLVPLPRHKMLLQISEEAIREISSRSTNQINFGSDLLLWNSENPWTHENFRNVDYVVTNHNNVRTWKQTSKPQTNYRCCLRFSFLMPYWLIPPNTVTFYKYFWCSQFCEFHCKTWKGWPNLFKFQSMSIPAIRGNWQQETVWMVEYSLNWTIFLKFNVKKKVQLFKKQQISQHNPFKHWHVNQGSRGILQNSKCSEG